MPIAAKPYDAQKKFARINGRNMAYFDEGQGDAIVFQHGNPTSSYLWRNIMPYCEGLGRLIACDLIGMGDSDKLEPSGPEQYSFREHSEYLYELWDHIGIGDNAVLVLHDWGSALGFNWARQNPGRVQAIAYMEALVAPLTWDTWPENAREIFQGFRSPAGEDLVLNKNLFIEAVLPNAIIRNLTDEEMAHYRKPFIKPGEDRRPTLSWPRQIPIDGVPADMVEIIENYAAWLAKSDIPKLFINADPGSILTGRPREICRKWPNQTEITVKGYHFVQEDCPDEIGQAVAGFIKTLRA